MVMRNRWWVGSTLAVAALVGGIASAQGAKPNPKVLRVCADPDNLPFSNEKGEGFDNKIAALIASDLGDSLTYTWWPTRRGFIRNTLSDRRCDVIMGVPKDYDPIVPSTPYYRANYVVVTRHDRGHAITSLDDPALAKLKIGIDMMGEDYASTPPGMALNQRGLGAQLVGFHTFYDATTRPGASVKAVADGTIDAAIVWGPIAGYFAKQSPVKLDIVALPDSDKVSGFQFAYDVVMGVRHGDRTHLTELNGVIARRKSDIDQILRDYGIPTAQPTGTTN
jgi:quinoprotein dehydrogenase-associated probable ABC transporter substrate-binding protein